MKESDFMSSYSQRFLGHQRYLSNAAEDILAVTVCLPFTMALFSWNAIADYLTELSFIPEGSDTKVWNAGRFILTLPLYTLKGLIALTVAPFIASILSYRGIEPIHHNFILGQWFPKLAFNRRLRFLFGLYLPEVFNYRLFWIGAGTGLIGYLFSPQLLEIGLQIWNLETVFQAVALTLPFLELGAQFAMALSVSGLFVLSASMLFANVEARLEKISQYTANLIDDGIYFVQVEMLKRGKVTFNNQQDAVSLEAVTDIPLENLYVSSSNYAFDLDNIESNVSIRGLNNYNSDPADGNHPRFDEDDIRRLEKHPNLQTRFPQLAQHLRDHKQEYTQRYSGIISTASIAQLRNLARAMLISQTAEPVRFAEEFVTAKEAFEAHLATVPAAEREAIHNINLLGGTDPEYRFQNVFEKACMPQTEEGWCKKGASRLFTETCDRIENQGEGNNFVAFWQRPQPTHWMGLHFR
jgi:hypothetical protein